MNSGDCALAVAVIASKPMHTHPRARASPRPCSRFDRDAGGNFAAPRTALFDRPLGVQCLTDSTGQAGGPALAPVVQEHPARGLVRHVLECDAESRREIAIAYAELGRVNTI